MDTLGLEDTEPRRHGRCHRHTAEHPGQVLITADQEESEQPPATERENVAERCRPLFGSRGRNKAQEGHGQERDQKQRFNGYCQPPPRLAEQDHTSPGKSHRDKKRALR